MKAFWITLLAMMPALFTFAQEKEVPDINVTSLDGKSVSVKDFIKKDKITVISFWATWCAPCKKELDNIMDLYPTWKETYGVEMIAMSTDDSRAFSKIAPMVAAKGWIYTILVDKNEDLKRALNIGPVPHTLIIDQNGNIVYEHSGYSEGAEFELEEKIIELSKGKTD
jgi:cytochrome c biogenesis protein CcmG, thiol:disulfide interchange protein DsbE